MGPLKGFKIVEMGGLGPPPYAAMLLSDMGAEVIQVEKIGGGTFGVYEAEYDIQNRSKKSICVNLKSEEGVEIVKKLIEDADALIEGYRPGVMEKFGLGPDDLWAVNPKLVYGRMTGWGQQGPLSDQAGHDINYIAVAGAQYPIGRAGEKPAIPLNFAGDYGGGSLFLVNGILAALLECQKSGKGQVVDAAMVDGAASLLTAIFPAYQVGFWSDDRGTNLLDSGAHFYEVYETKDGGYLSFGAVEPQFYQALIAGLGLEGEELPDQMDSSNWPAMKEKFEAIVKTRTRDEWMEIFDGKNACVSPVLSMGEAPLYPANQARNTYLEIGGAWHPTPAPRFSRTENDMPTTAPALGQDTDEILTSLGYSDSQIGQMKTDLVIA
jgi:alpha-methylacyl-CoA racemase